MEESKTSTLVKLTGKPTYIVFRNDETMYTVLRFELNDKSEKVITATGILPSVEPFVLCTIIGEYVEHPRYGMQFKIHSMQKALPQEKEGAIRFLSSDSFPGIGRKTAAKIVEELGENCLEDLKKDPSLADQLEFLSDDKKTVLKDGMANSDQGLEDLIVFLNVHGIGMRNLIRLNKTYGNEALQKIKENPYRVIDECDGFGFATADKIAMSLGFEKNDKRRVYAYLVSLLMQMCVQSGDSFVNYDALEQEFYKTINFPIDISFEELLTQAKMNHKVIQEEQRVYPISQFQSEEYIAFFLQGFLNRELQKVEQKELEEVIDGIEKVNQITYDAQQKEAIFALFESPFTILTGGPGSGKTTVVTALIDAYKKIYPNAFVQCVAPTGRAAKRLEETTGNEATTIHSLLKWDLEANVFGMNEENPIDADFLIIDEFSMVDTWLFANLLKACENVKHICIIGDEDQLPSVSPGCVLRDLIASNAYHLTRLNHIYRQKEGSDVITLAHDMIHGSINFDELTNDVAFFECSRYQIKDYVLKIVENAFERGYGIHDIQVLSPMYNGPAGIDVLNVALQEMFNPKEKHKRELKYGYRIYREGDKILQLKNQPDDNVYNGDIGVLTDIIFANESDTKQAKVIVDFNGEFVEYSLDNLDNITHAYCISIHKSQGSEYPIVIMPITYQYYYMLQRKLLYTGVTRARQSLVLVGEKGAFYQGVETLERHIRLTSLQQRIEKYQTMNEDYGM